LSTDDKDTKAAAAARTRSWRERKRQQPGGLTQVITWVPQEYAVPLRHIFTKLGDPDWPGAMYRRAVAHWAHRRRPAPMRMPGNEYSVEIDGPEIDDDAQRVPAGGRVFGPDGTLIELTPYEASELDRNLREAIDQAAHTFLTSRGKQERLDDFTGVLSNDALITHARVLPADLYESRPESDEQFAASEAMRFAQVFDTREQVRIVEVAAGLLEIVFPGTAGLPSRCLAFLGMADDFQRGLKDRNVLALIGVPRAGGTPPTLAFARLVKVIKEHASLHDIRAELCLLDVEPDQFSVTTSVRIAEVVQDKDDPERLAWRADPRLTFELQRNLREALQVYEEWRRSGRLSAEERDALESLAGGEFD
jgi:hypothetical protein